MPPLPGSAVILPSDVIAVSGHYLPEVRFNDDSGHGRVAAERNEAMGEAQTALIDVITFRMQGASAKSYDDIATVTVAGGVNRQVEFADALHAYVGALVGSLGVFIGISPDHGEDRTIC